jgi:hypothetical protein
MDMPQGGKSMMQSKITQAKPTRQQTVDRLLDQLPTMKRAELLKLWRSLFDREAGPQLRRETMIPILAYRIQEKAYGGLKESTARKLRELAEDHLNGRQPVVQPMLRPKIGTRYVREHAGKLHEVTVLEAGYEYNNKTYRNLSEIARFITGTKWSGPAFFGQRRSKKEAIR